MHDVATLPLLLKELRLPTIGNLWESKSQEAEQKGWSYGKYITCLCEMEVEERQQRRIKAFMKQSGLLSGKSLATFDFNQIEKLNKAQINNLSQHPVWVEQAENILIFGPSGVGKTHLASAIGHALVEQGIRVLLTSTTKLVQKLQTSKRDLNLPAALEKLDRYKVLILDDIGYVKKDDMETHVLFELIAHRYEARSLIITANQPFSEWDSIFENNAMTVAAIDRLVHHSTIIEMLAESYRKKQSIEKKKD